MSYFANPRTWKTISFAVLFAGAIGLFSMFNTNGSGGNSQTQQQDGVRDTLMEPMSDGDGMRRRRLLDTKQLKQKFQVAQAKMIQGLKEDYGAELFEKAFMIDWNNGTERVTQGRRYFSSPSVPEKEQMTQDQDKTGLSWDRMVRRMAIKILSAQLDDGSGRKTNFIWATGGHSA